MHTIKAHVRSTALTIHNLSTRWTGWSASCPSHFTTTESSAVPAEQEGRWDPETGLDCFGEGKNLALVWNLTMIHWLAAADKSYTNIFIQHSLGCSLLQFQESLTILISS